MKYDVYLYKGVWCYVYENDSTISCYLFNWFSSMGYQTDGLGWRESQTKKCKPLVEFFLKSFDSLEELKEWIKTEEFIYNL